jgi:hypothetical protein
LQSRAATILKLADAEKGMTAEQFARAMPFSRGEKKLDPIRIRKTLPSGQVREYEYPGTYQLTIQALNRLHKKGLLGKNREISIYDGKVNWNAKTVWVKAGRDYNVNPDNRQHEIDCADLLCSLTAALHPNTERLSHWDYQWSDEELEYYGIEADKGSAGPYFDRRFVLDGKLFFLEVDRGTKDPKKVKEQFARYVDFSRSFPDERFTVLITAQGYRHMTEEANANRLLEMTGSFKRGNQFLVTFHRFALANPLGRVWKSPMFPEGFLTIEEAITNP